MDDQLAEVEYQKRAALFRFGNEEASGIEFSSKDAKPSPPATMPKVFIKTYG